MQVAWVQVWYMCQWVELRKNVTGASCSGWNHHVCKWSICANGWERTTTTEKYSCPWQALQVQGTKVRVWGAKVRTSISTKYKSQGTRCKGQDQHQHKLERDAATYMRMGTQFKFLVCPALIYKLQWLLYCALHQHELVGGGGGGWSCMLLLHPAPPCIDASPDFCTLYPDICTLCLQWLSLAVTYGGGR